MATVAELQQIQEQLRVMNTDVSEELATLVAVELLRRRKAGRPSSGISRKESNRIAQQRFRDKKKSID